MTKYLTFNADFDNPDFAAAYDELPLWSAKFGFLLLENIELRQDITVLDVGCGTGFPLHEIAQRLGPSCTVCGIDPWQAAVERAKFKAEEYGLGNVDICLGDATAMPFSDNVFDLIVSNLGVNNFENPEAALAECFRVAKPSARIALTSNLKGHMKEFYNIFKSTLRSVGSDEELARLLEHIDHRTTLVQSREILEKSGFKVVKTIEESFVMRFSNGSALLNHSFIKLGFLDGWKKVVSPERMEMVFTELEKNLNRVADETGELVLTIPMAYVEGIKV